MQSNRQRFFDIKRTQIQMVRDRGYIIPQQELAILDMNDINEFIEFIRTTPLTEYYLKKEGETIVGAIFVHYAKRDNGKARISIETARGFVATLTNGIIYEGIKIKLLEGIMICEAPLSSDASKALKELIDPKWQVFNESELTYNPTYHMDTVIHQLLTREEKEERLRECGVDITQFPLIEATDPIVKYYGWAVGSLIRVIRDDSYIGILGLRSINYRVVVDTL